MALDNFNDVPNVSPFPTALRMGMIGGGLCIVFGLVSYLIGIDSTVSKVMQYLNYVVWIAFVVMAIKQHRDKDLGGFISYGRALGVGMLTALIMAIMSVIWTVLLYKVIDPNFAEKTMEIVMQQWEEKGISDDQIEDMMPMVSRFMSVGPISGIILFTISLIGFVTSLISGAVLKKNRPGA